MSSKLVALSLILLGSTIYADEVSLDQHLAVLACDDSSGSQVKEAWRSLSRHLVAMSPEDPKRNRLIDEMDSHFVKWDVLQIPQALKDYLYSRNSNQGLPEAFCPLVSREIKYAIRQLVPQVKTADEANEKDERMFAAIQPWLYAAKLLSNPGPLFPELIDLFSLSFDRFGIRANTSALLIADTLLTLAQRNEDYRNCFWHWMNDRTCEGKFADALKLFAYFQSADQTRPMECPTPNSVRKKYLEFLPPRLRPSLEETESMKTFLRLVQTYLSGSPMQKLVGDVIIREAVRKIVDPSAETTLAGLGLVQHCVSELVLSGIGLIPKAPETKGK